MRETKFRGISVETGEMVYGALINNMFFDSKTKNPVFYIVDTSQYEDYDSFADVEYMAVLVKPDSVGQFTGLQDRNGKEIYEGDILKVSPYQDEEHTVKVYHLYSALIIDTPFSSEHDWTPLGYYKRHFGEHTIEVIGNIYTHPHLLKEETTP